MSPLQNKYSASLPPAHGLMGKAVSISRIRVPKLWAKAATIGRLYPVLLALRERHH
jgi:hypothetical protein